jgi:phosphoglycerate dehydrogenase-like enzyme
VARTIINLAAIYNDPEIRQRLCDGGFELVDVPNDVPRDKPNLIRLLQGAEAVIANSERYDDDVFAGAPTLRHVARWGVGYDAVDLAAATRAGVVVTNTPGVITDAVADMAFTLLCGLARRLREGDMRVRSGGWGSLVSAPIGGATIGIVGLGVIGACAARRAKGFGMRILAFDPVQRPELVDELGVEYVDLDTLLRESDFVTLHCNATPENRGFIGRAQFEMMKPTAFLINCGRGSLVDQKALVEALTTGQIAGAGLDVFEKEPPDADDPLLKLDNCLFMPHTATMDRRTIAKVSNCVTDTLLAFLRDGAPINVVNPDVLGKLRGAAG